MSKNNLQLVSADRRTLGVNGHVKNRMLDMFLNSYSHLEANTIEEIFNAGLEKCRESIEDADKAFHFCVIYSDFDQEVSHQLKRDLETHFHLSGCTIEDWMRLGQHLLKSYETMIDSSCKALFVLTPSFTKDRFQERIQNSAIFQSLLDRASNKSHEKCVPVIMENADRTRIDIPFAFKGINGLIYNPMHGLYVPNFQGICGGRSMIEQRKKIQQQIDNRYCIKFIDDYLKDQLETESLLEFPSPAIEPASSRALALPSSGAQPLAVLSSSRNTNQEPMQAVVSQIVQALPVINSQALAAMEGGEASSSASVPLPSTRAQRLEAKVENSSNVTVGDTINISINVYPKDLAATNRGDSQSSSDDSD